MVSGTDTPDWQGNVAPAAALNVVATGFALATGATQHLVPGFTPLVLQVVALAFSFQDVSGALMQVQSTAAQPIFLYLAKNVGKFYLPLGGLPLAQGAGIDVTNLGLANMANTDFITVYYQPVTVT